MKRIVLACCFFAVSVIMGVTVYFSINSLCDTIIEQAEMCLEIANAGDIETLIKASDEFNQNWEELHDSFTLVTSKSNIDALEENIPSLKHLAEIQAIDLYCEKCLECINTLEVLKRNEKVNLGNIF